MVAPSSKNYLPSTMWTWEMVARVCTAVSSGMNIWLLLTMNVIWSTESGQLGPLCKVSTLGFSWLFTTECAGTTRGRRWQQGAMNWFKCTLIWFPGGSIGTMYHDLISRYHDRKALATGWWRMKVTKWRGSRKLFIPFIRFFNIWLTYSKSFDRAIIYDYIIYSKFFDRFIMWL